jgi:hypothetical protein
MDDNTARQIKIYCPQHQTVSEVEEKPQIICEIREHSLSNDFPRSEFWEYCCDCRIFSPSNYGSGGRANENCRHCERPTLRRFLCDECKIVSYESDEDPKGKYFGIGTEGVRPVCPGCRKTFGDRHANQHQCADIEGFLMTHRAECPFCRKSTVVKASEPKQIEPFPVNVPPPDSSEKTASTQCTKCGHWGFAGRIHCGKCGTQLKSLTDGVSPGSASPRTQLLGSICPNCGTGNQAESYFCNSCGQALKVSNAAPPVNLPPPVPTTQPTVPLGAQTIPPTDFQAKSAPAGQNKPILAVVIGGLVLIFILGLIAFNAKKTGSDTVTNSSPAPTRSPTGTTVSRTSTPTATNTNTSSSSAIVGRRGRLMSNLNIRSAPNKVAEIRGTHYEGAKVEVLATESYTTQDEYVTWYKVRVLEDGCDRVGGNGCGNNWERNGSFGWLEAETEGWMNSKYITLE